MSYDKRKRQGLGINHNRRRVRHTPAGSTLQKSADAQNFSTIKTASARNDGNKKVYDYTDDQPQTGNNYYRVKIYNTYGTVSYSNVVLVKTARGEAAFSIYPNPIARNQQLKVQFSKMVAGRHALVLYSTSGRA